MKAYANEFANGWRGGPGVCGASSQERFAAPDRRRLADVITEWRTRHDGLEPRILEIGCGDLRWHADLLPAIYVGIDLEPRPEWKAAEEAGARFLEGNACFTTLPRSDIAIARQVFIHLSNEAILAILDNLRAAQVEWLLASTVPGGGGANEDRLPGGGDYSIEGFPVDLDDIPFLLPYALPVHRGGAMRLFALRD